MTPLASNPIRQLKPKQTMTNLTYTKSEQFAGLEVVILNDGSAYCTQSSYARFSGKDQSVISRRSKELEIIEIKDFNDPTQNCIALIKTSINTPTRGLQECVLIPAKIFARWIAKDNPELFDEVMEAGATQFLYKVAGYELKAVPQQEFNLPQNYLEALKALVTCEEEKERLAQENAELQQEVIALAEIADELFDYSSIVRVSKYNDCSEKQFTWRQLKSVSQQLGLEIKKAPCPRYNTKNLYHHDAWRIAYPDVNLPESSMIVKM